MDNSARETFPVRLLLPPVFSRGDRLKLLFEVLGGYKLPLTDVQIKRASGL